MQKSDQIYGCKGVEYYGQSFYAGIQLNRWGNKMNKMNKEQKIWFIAGVIGSIILYGILIMASVYNIRFKYGFHIMILTYFVAFWSLVMYALTKYFSTREIVSTLARKIREW